MPQERDDQSLWELLKVSTSDERAKLIADVLALTLSLQVRALRKSRGWTLEEAASKSGLSYATVHRLEQADTVLSASLSSLLDYAKAYDVALVVRFAGWKEWLERMLTREAFVPAPFDAERLAAVGAQP